LATSCEKEKRLYLSKWKENGGKTTMRHTQNGKDRLIKRNIEIRGGNWNEIQENRKWENRDSWRFL
jgi:hypothetical protein